MPHRRHQPIPHPAGFSIVELAIVVLILAVVMAVVVPMAADSAAYRRTHSSARKLIADLALARAEAVRSEATVTVTFYVAGDYYRTTADHGLPRHIESAVVLARPPYEVDLLSADFDGSTQLEFDPYGQASAAGTVRLGAGSYVVIVTVDQESGLAHLD